MTLAHVILSGQCAGLTTTAATIWRLGATSSYAQLTSGTALEAVSSSANDTAAGTGARTIKIYGVDSTYTPFSETVTLAGATPVALANTSVIGINSAVVVTAGSSLINAGNIDIRTVSGSTVKCSIPSAVEAAGQSHEFIFTVPANQYALMKRIQVHSRTNTGDFWVYLKTYNSSGVSAVRAVGQSSLYVTGFNGGWIDMNFGAGLLIPEKTLLTLIGDVTAGTPTVSAIGELELYSM